jgi:hypothetical protein
MINLVDGSARVIAALLAQRANSTLLRINAVGCRVASQKQGEKCVSARVIAASLGHAS